ncbi:MAG TPA: prolipoprotein diacylglyceryl transferase family protein [Micromonosporaceae bacterium]|nr:prolipoprotein diacylglyceryl transferase family protein [Micromonosporaceae bacterium]
MLHPVLVDLGGVPILTHDAFVALGVLVGAAVFVREARLRGNADERLWGVVAGALVGGVLLGRLGTWAQHLDPRGNASLVEQWAYGNRSILSGLVGAYLGAIVAKRLMGYRERTGDLFAPAIALGMAVGRIGCLLSELPGTPTSLPWGVVLTPAEAATVPGGVAGVPLHPSFGYEILFQLVAFGALRWLRPRITVPGELFSLYLVAYAVFRFAVEYVRGNETVLAGLTRPQLFLLACLPIAGWQLARQARRGVYANVFRRPAELEVPG